MLALFSLKKHQISWRWKMEDDGRRKTEQDGRRRKMENGSWWSWWRWWRSKNRILCHICRPRVGVYQYQWQAGTRQPSPGKQSGCLGCICTSVWGTCCSAIPALCWGHIGTTSSLGVWFWLKGVAGTHIRDSAFVTFPALEGSPSASRRYDQEN